MKKIFGLLLLLQITFGFGQIRWISINQALEEQKKHPKKILIDFYSHLCQPCQDMGNRTFNNPIISKLINSHFYAVKFDSDSNDIVNFAGRTFSNPDYNDNRAVTGLHQFAKFMNISTMPTMVFLDEKAAPITNLMGALSAKDVEPYFNMISSGEYKNIKTREQWDNYQKKFKSKIKE